MTSKNANNGRPQLVTAEWLLDHLQDQDLLLLDASPTPSYVKAHIPGAVSVSFPEEESVSEGVSVSYGGGGDYFFDVNAACAWHEAPDSTFEKAYRMWGVSKDRTIVICDQGGTIFATRLFFSLYFHGFPLKKLFILDGGLHRWQRCGFPTTTMIGKPRRKGDFRIARKRKDSRSYLPEIIEAAGDPSGHALVEGLSPAWHTGAYHAYSKPGHIPHAISLPFSDFYTEEKTFKPASEIRRMLRHLQIRPTQRIHTHCGGGIAGSVPFFAIRFLAAYPDVRHFIESQVAYLNDPRDLPFWTYDAPYRLRDAGWLQWWGGQRTRSLGSIRVSIVDVRSPQSFARSHIPYSINLPLRTLFERLSDTQALCELLGAAGVNPRHEVVVVSGGGADTGAMLAALIFDQLGHKKVSVLSQTLRQWEGLGYPLTDKPTRIAPQRLRFDLAIAPLTYRPARTRPRLIRQLGETRGRYPKLIVDCGDVPVTKIPGDAGEQRLHMPVANLLLSHSGVKSAADISASLEQHGVQRYAEIITVARDPADAAAMYFILGLMGYPDVKVLIPEGATMPQ